LGALGAVLRSTALLKALKKKHPFSRLVWVTESPAQNLLLENPLIDEVLLASEVALHPLTSLTYSHAYSIDKSLKAHRLVQEFNTDKILGFRCDPISGGVLPASESARELWEIGLSDEKKFFKNSKTETQLIHEALELGPFLREEYLLRLSPTEQMVGQDRRRKWKDNRDQILIGMNVGCSSTIPYKKLSEDAQRKFIDRVKELWGSRVQIVLLGGREDLDLANRIAKERDVILSPMNLGLRDGISSLFACDIVVTGDSLGLHLGVALNKWVVAWFGPTCAHEIDLYDRGVKILSQVPCSPCWKRVCDRSIMCYDQVPLSDLIDGVEKGVKWKSLSSKQPFQETCS